MIFIVKWWCNYCELYNEKGKLNKVVINLIKDF